MTISLRARGVRAVVLDVEGTTTPIAFVNDTLFPYAREHLREFLREHFGSAVIEEPVRLLRDEWEEDVARDENPPAWRDVDRDDSLDCIAAYVLWLMHRDRKSPGLKLLQGQIWERGYRDGSLRGDVFDDVPRALERWRADGIVVAVYSSGSVLAQRLLFSTTTFGDLTSHIAAHFDTGVGSKRDAASYARIADALGVGSSACLFVSDIDAELEAASSAGWQVVLCLRPGDSTDIGSGRDVIATFDEITS